MLVGRAHCIGLRLRGLQVPVLFTGSMRDNLDPFHEHPDSAVMSRFRPLHQPAFLCMPCQLPSRGSDYMRLLTKTCACWP